jgi:hypothetical protein
MEFLVLLMIGLYAFIAWAPEQLTQACLAAVWGLMLVSAVVSVLYSVLS